MRKPAELENQLFVDNWPIRRRWLRIGLFVLTANAELVLYRIVFGETPDALVVQIFLALLAAIIALFGTYVFGAVWDDNNKRFHFRSRRDRDAEPAAPAPEPEDE